MMDDANHSGTVKADPTLFDMLLKYGALFAAGTYGLGFMEEWDFVARIIPGGGSDFPLANPRYLAVGSLLAFSTFAVPVAGWVAPVFARQVRLGGGSYGRGRFLAAFLLTFAAAFMLGHWRFHAWIREALGLAAITGTVNVFVAWILWTQPVHHAQSVVSQAAQAVVVVLLLAFFADAASIVHGRIVLTQDARRSVRLLVAPDAVHGAEELGLVFPLRTKGSQISPELSAPVQLVFEGDRSYIFRLETGGIVHLSKDRVWGTEP